MTITANQCRWSTRRVWECATTLGRQNRRIDVVYVLIVRKIKQVWMVGRIAIAKNQTAVTPLVVVTVHQANYGCLNIHQFPEMQASAIYKVQIAPDQSGA